VGTCLSIRPVRTSDLEGVRGLFQQLSATSRYRRFFSPLPVVDDRFLRRFVDVDHRDHEAVVALCGDDIVGLASYDRAVHDAVEAEVAVMVADAWHHQGVGRLLTRALGVAAYERGIDRFTAEVLGGNVAPVHLARRMAPSLDVSFVDGHTHLVMPLRRSA